MIINNKNSYSLSIFFNPQFSCFFNNQLKVKYIIQLNSFGKRSCFVKTYSRLLRHVLEVVRNGRFGNIISADI